MEVSDEKTTLQHLGSLLNNPNFSDVSFLVDKKKFDANRCILASRSKVFQKMLYGNLREASQTEITINDPNVNSDAFLSLMRFIYTGKVEIDPKNALNILYLANMYDVEFLGTKCREFVKNVTSEEDILGLWSSAIALGEEEIAKSCQNSVVENTDKVLLATDPKDVSKEVLLAIVSSTALNINEFDLFQFVHQWTKTHEPIPKEVLDEIISHIRFPHISTSNLIKVVKPTNLCPLEVYMEAIEFQSEPLLFDKTKIQFKERMEWLPFQFNSNRNMVELSSDKKTASGKTVNWCPVLGNCILKKHFWEFSFKCAISSAIICGVALDDVDLKPGMSIPGTWGFYDHSPSYYGSGEIVTTSSVAPTFRSGDRIAFYVDVGKGLIMWFCNDVWKGEGKLMQGKSFVPYFCLYGADYYGSVTLTRYIPPVQVQKFC